MVDDLRVLAEEKHQTITTKGEPVTIEGDPDTLRLVLVNLLDNAITYTPEGGRIIVRVGPHDDSEAAVEVEDTGPDRCAARGQPGRRRGPDRRKHAGLRPDR